MKAINVSRVSTEEQKEAGNSLPAQIERIRKYCERKGFDVAEKDIFSFDESAYKEKRDDFDNKVIVSIKETKKSFKIDELPLEDQQRLVGAFAWLITNSAPTPDYY